MPEVKTVTVVPLTVQTLVVAEVNATVSPELEVAVKDAGVAPYVMFEGVVKEIACVAIVNVNVRLLEVAMK
jgi:hypothetical protein